MNRGSYVHSFLHVPEEIPVLIVGIAVLLAIISGLNLRSLRGRKATAMELQRLIKVSEQMAATQADLSQRLAASQADLSGRLQQSQSNVNERLDLLSQRLGDGLAQQTEKTGHNLKELEKRLAVIDRAQQTITGLSQQMVCLQDILSNKQSRGAFGEIQLRDIVIAALPPSAFEFQWTLSNGKRADCLLKLPNPPGSIVVDSKFPLESFQALREARRRRLQALGDARGHRHLGPAARPAPRTPPAPAAGAPPPRHLASSRPARPRASPQLGRPRALRPRGTHGSAPGRASAGRCSVPTPSRRWESDHQRQWAVRLTHPRTEHLRTFSLAPSVSD